MGTAFFLQENNVADFASFRRRGARVFPAFELMNSSKTKLQPLRWVAILKGGARDRADDVLLFRRNKRTPEQSGLCSGVVPLPGIERVRFIQPRDFKSLASANSATAA